MGAGFIVRLFKNTTKTIDNECFINRNKLIATAFTRNRKLTFKNLLLTLMSFTRPGVQTELDRFFKVISKSSDAFESISKSAFTQSRRNLNPEVFNELTKAQLNYFVNNAPIKKTWKDHRVIGIDGSLLNLPTSNELREEFGSVKNQHDEIISARCSFAYDVCNELILDSKIDKRRSCEKVLASQHLSHLNADTDILVFDRGYPSHWLIGLLLKQNFKFCFRLSTAWKAAFEELENSTGDINWTMVHRAHKGMDKLKELDIPKKIEGLRLVSIKLLSGENEVLLTNLTDREKFNIKDLKQLYHLRWGVEEAYKSFKQVLKIEYFTGKTVIAVKQDFYAKVFMLNLASLIKTQGLYTHEGKPGQSRKYKYQPNKTQVIAKTKDFLVDLFLIKDIKALINQMLTILHRRTEIIRPNRSNPRLDASTRRRLKGLNARGI